VSKKKIKKKKKKLKFSPIEKEIMQLALKGKNLDEIMILLDLDIVEATGALLNIQKNIAEKGFLNG
jgi:DNA-binding CsgD family transcriptional regulator